MLTTVLAGSRPRLLPVGARAAHLTQALSKHDPGASTRCGRASRRHKRQLHTAGVRRPRVADELHVINETGHDESANSWAAQKSALDKANTVPSRRPVPPDVVASLEGELRRSKKRV